MDDLRKSLTEYIAGLRRRSEMTDPRGKGQGYGQEDFGMSDAYACVADELEDLLEEHSAGSPEVERPS